jgi:hypothetical protein
VTLIDAYLPAYQFREFHQLLVDAAPADLLDAIDLPGIVDDPWVQWFIQLREIPGRLLSAMGRRNRLHDRAAFGLNDFTQLGRDADREVAFRPSGEVLAIRLPLAKHSGFCGISAIQDRRHCEARAQFLRGFITPRPYPPMYGDSRILQ